MTANTMASGRVVWLLCAAILVVVILAGNSDLLLGKASPIWDAGGFYGPLFALVGDYARAGHLLTWNPWMNGGSPDFADPQVGTASPMLLAFGILFSNFSHGFTAYWLTVWIMGAFGMLLLTRHLGAPAWAGLVVTLGFVASGFYTSHGEHTTILYSFSLLPWILWRFDVALNRRSFWEMAVAGMLWGLSALGGYPALVILTPLFLGLWALGWWWLDRTGAEGSDGRLKRLLFVGIGLGIFCIVGVAVMSPCYIGFLLYTKGYTTRTGGISREYALSLPLPPQAIGTLASPFLYLLNGPPYSIWPETDIAASSIYSGALVIVAAVIALLRPRKWQVWIGAIVLFFLACSVGKHLPIRGWLYDFVLPTRYFRFPSFFSAYSILGLCLLAVYGLLDIDSAQGVAENKDRGKFILISALVAVAAFLAYRSILHTAHLGTNAFPHPFRVFTLIWLSILVVLFLWWTKDITKRLLISSLMLIAIYDGMTALQISKPTLYSGAANPWWDVMVSKHVTSLDLTANGLRRDLLPPDELGHYQHDRNVVLRIPTLGNYTGMVNPFFDYYVNDPVLGQLATGQKRIWFSARPIWLPPSEAVFAEYLTASHTLGIPPLVLHRPESMSGPKNVNDPRNWSQGALPASAIDVQVERYSPNELSFRVNAPEDGWILVTDRWAPYWYPKVNGREVPNTGANFIFRAVPVNRGENLVSFLYQPKGYLGLVLLSWGTIGFIAIGGAVRLTARKSKQQGKISDVLLVTPTVS
jgi:hypothetical protein